MPDFSSWSPRDIALLGGALGATYADVQSTKDLIKRGGAETNPIYGTGHPTGAALDQGGLIAAGIATAIAHGIPEEHRGTFLGGWLGLEGALAQHNAGIKASDKKSSFSDVLSTAGPGMLTGALAGHFMPSGLLGGTLTPSLMQNGEGKKPSVALSYRKDF